MTSSRWDLGAATLSIAEQASVGASPALVDAVEPDLWGRLKLRASRAAGESSWEIRASQYVGVARVPAGGKALPLEVVPKLPVDVFFLADHAFGTRERNAIVDRHLRADLAAIRTDPTACLIAWFLADVEAFARRFLRRSYRLRREVIEGGLRERLLLEEYVGRHLAAGRAQEVPCEFADLTVDTAANRVIRGTVRLALARRALLSRPEARVALGRRGRQVLSLLAGVRDERLQAATFRRLANSPRSAHYERILSHCEAFASGLYMEREIGPKERQAFLWDMNALFEEGLRGILGLWPRARLEPSRPQATIEDAAGRLRRSSRVNPDFVLRVAGGADLVLDAKYKATGFGEEEAMPLTVAGRKIRVRRGDIYQAVAYRAHDRYQDCRAGLVFPVALGGDQPLPEPHLVRGFGAPLHLFFLDVGEAAERNLAGFFDSLAAVAEA